MTYYQSEDEMNNPAAPAETGSAVEGEQKQAARWFQIVVDILETLVVALLIFVGINLVTARIRVDGYSMYPTFVNGEYLIVNKLAYRWTDPQRGDVIVFHNPQNPQEEYIKRVIGLPGETVQVTGGLVYVNGVPLDEPYISAAPAYEDDWLIPSGAYFVLGDNRNNSSDSHSWGTVEANLIVGKAVLVYWPLTELSLVEHVTQAKTTP